MRDKITPKKLNKSADQRLIPNTGLIDALNVLITSSEGDTGNEGVIKAARGNQAISYKTSTGEGLAKVIGAVTDQRLKVIYMFVYSAVPQDHGVYVYDPYGNLPGVDPEQVVKVFTSAKFAFDEFGYVKGDVVYINNTTDTSGEERYEKDCILYFTDGRSEPKKLNVFRCLLGDYTEGDVGPNETDFITACPKLGLKTLSARFAGDNTRSTSNFVNTKGFQFAYQLIYKDGIETAISPYSDIMFPPVIVKQGAQEVVDYVANNLIEIEFDANIQNRTEIEKIRLLAREGNDGSFFAIDEFEKDKNIILGDTTTIWNGGDFAAATATSLVYKFYNDKVVTGVDPNEVAKQYDALPRLAKAQAVINNRLMYGNYIDGFDEQTIVCSSSIVFKERPDDFISGQILVKDLVREIPASNKLAGNTVRQFNKTTTYEIDCSQLPDLAEDTLINLTIQILPQQNFHLYDARNSYHQNATKGHSSNYNFFFSGGWDSNNLAAHSKTYQTPQAAGEGFLMKADGHGNDGNQYFPYFGNNPGVIKNLKWTSVDGPPTDTEQTVNYVGRQFDAVVGTSAANPFIIPAKGAEGQLSFSVTLKTLEDGVLPNAVSRALAAALSGVTNFASIGLPAFQLQSANILPVLEIDQGYQNFERFYDHEDTGKLVMGIGRKSAGDLAQIGGGGVQGGGNQDAGYHQTDGAPVGYALLNKASVEFMFEQNWGLELYTADGEPTGNTVVTSNDVPEQQKKSEVRLAIKDISNMEFSTCMRRLDTRQIKLTLQLGYNPGDHSRIPMMANGAFDMYDNSPWFVLNDTLLASPSFSLQQYASQLPPAPDGPSQGDSLKGYLENTDGGEYADLANDINFTLFRYATPEQRAASVHVKQLTFPDCALSMVTGLKYLESTIDYEPTFGDSFGDTDYQHTYDQAITQTLQGSEEYASYGPPEQYVEMVNRPYKNVSDTQHTFACHHSVYPSDNFRYNCGRLSFASGQGVLGDGYDTLEQQGEDGMPPYTETSPNAEDYYNNTRFKLSLLDGADGPGGFKRIPQGQPSIYGSISYLSTVPRISTGGYYGAAGGGHGLVMTGVFWNGNIHSGDLSGYGLAGVGASYDYELDDLGLDFTVPAPTYSYRGVIPVAEAGYTTLRSQDGFYMPGIIPFSIWPNRAQDIGNTHESGPPDGWDNPDAGWIYRPLIALKKTAEYTENDTYFGGGALTGEWEKQSAGYIQDRIYRRNIGNTQAESTSFASIVDAGDLEDRTFKSSAFHDFGIVYYDERGRHGFVNPATTVYVPGYSDTERGSNGGKGKVEITLDFTGTTPPSWAKYYKLVYAPNSTVDFFVQHMAGGAYTPSFNAETGASVIYVSLNYLQESVVSYTSAFGARGPEGELNIYKYKEGDRVRIVSYAEGDTREYPSNFEFDIVDVKNLGPFENPLWTDNDVNAPNWLQGQFLVLRNNPLAGEFSFDAVNQGNHKWGDNCLIEIYSPSKKTSETAVYYEIPDQSYTTVDYLPYCSGGALYPQTVTVTQGDTWWRPVAMNIRKQATGDEDPGLTNISSSGYVDVIKDTPSTAPAGTNPLSVPNFLPVTAESMTASDLIDGDSSFIGRPNVYLPGAKETRREATITYSDFNNPEATKVRYSSFNYALSNYKDLNEEFGGIDYMMNESGDILVIQNERVSMVPASKTLFSDASGENTVVASTNILGTAKTFGLRAGCDGNPESVAVTPENVVFFAHKTLGKIYKYQPGGGVSTISDKNMASFFRRAFQDALDTSSEDGYADIRIPGGYDPLTKEYLITIKDVGDDEVGGETYNPTEEDVYGCMNPDAENYNPIATIDDGSCVYEEVEVECLAVSFSYDPSSFNYGVQQITEDQILEDETIEFSTEIDVIITNDGDDTATITGVDLYQIEYAADFQIATDLVGTEVAPGESVTLGLTWNPSTAYDINPGASVKVSYVNQDGCSSKIDFLSVQGKSVLPTDDPPAPPKWVKIYEQGVSEDTFATDIENEYIGWFAIGYENYVENQGFPAVGQVQENPVAFNVSGNPINTGFKQFVIETSGITPEDNVVISFTADLPFNQGQDLQTSSPDNPNFIAPAAFGNPSVTLDATILNQTQYSDGSSSGQFLFEQFSIEDVIMLPGKRSLLGADTWHAGLEAASEWIEHPSTEYVYQDGADYIWEDGWNFTVNIAGPEDMYTNLNGTGGNSSKSLEVRQKLVAKPTTNQNNTYVGNVRNQPQLVREKCALPECNQYDSSGETSDLVVGFWTNPLYQAFTDFTVAQPPSMSSNVNHPNLTDTAEYPFFVTTNWYNSSSALFPPIDVLAEMQIGKNCGGSYGCTTETACNYDPEATVDDGSCTFPEENYDCDGNYTGVVEVYGCTNPSSSNYNPDATVDDGSCLIEGCTNPTATNYNPDANVDDGTCIVYGCTDSNAGNYNPDATEDDGSCECAVSFPCSLDQNGSGVITYDEASGAYMLARTESNMNPPFPTFRAKYPAFASCTDEQIIDFWDQNNDGVIGLGDDAILNSVQWPVDCEGSIESAGLEICVLLDENGEVTAESVADAFGPPSGGVFNTTYASGIDFDGDGVVTSNDFAIATELIGLTSDHSIFFACQIGFRPDPGRGKSDPDPDPDQGYPLCQDFPPQTVRCGCMDPSADNFDPSVQAHTPESCVYSDGGGRGSNPRLKPGTTKY